MVFELDLVWILFASLLVFGVATVGAAIKTRRSVWDVFKRATVTTNPEEPPQIENDAGWQLIHSDDADGFEDWLGKDSSPSLGSHLLIEFYDCDEDALRQEVSVGEAMMQAAQESDASIVATSFHEFKPFGVSGAVIIQESHYTIHTWPEHRFAAVDLFYCSDSIHVEKAVHALRERFQPGRIKFLVVRRGLRSEV